MGFSRKATTCLLHPPSPPLALRSLSTAVAMTTMRGRLAASCRPKVQHSGAARVLNLAWPLFSSGQRDILYLLRGPRDTQVVDCSKPGWPHSILPPARGLCSFLTPSFEPSLSAPCPLPLSPWVFWNGALGRTDSLSSLPPTYNPDSRVDCG